MLYIYPVRVSYVTLLKLPMGHIISLHIVDLNHDTLEIVTSKTELNSIVDPQNDQKSFLLNEEGEGHAPDLLNCCTSHTTKITGSLIID